MKKGTFFLLFLVFNSWIICSQSLKLITYNIRLNTEADGENAWPSRSDFLASQILFYEPDILGIQEALPEQVNDLDSLLKDYDHFGKARETDNKGEASSIFYLKSRFTLFEESTFWLSETPDVVSRGWDAACNRVCTYGLLYDKSNKNFLWVFNTHLDHMGEKARTNGLKLILNQISGINPNKYPVVFMGDLNSTPDSDRIKNLMNYMDDCRSVCITKPFGPPSTFNSFDFCKNPESYIDYIFISKNSNYQVRKFAVLTDSKDLKYPSDHFPVFAELHYVQEK